MNWKFWVKKPKSEIITKTDNIHKNYNCANTRITVSAFEGGVECIAVEAFDPAVAEAIYNRVYEKLKVEKRKQ